MVNRAIVTICSFLAPGLSGAQDVAINNGRIIDGTGRTMETGSVLFRNGRIVSVTKSDQQASVVIDAEGKTLMPGMIDTHVHLITGPAPESYPCDAVIDHLGETLGAYLDRGFTTLFSTGDRFPDITTLKARIESGQVRGPRLLVVGPVFAAPDHPAETRRNFCNSTFPAQSDEVVRDKVRELAAAGVDGIKITFDSAWPPKLDDALVSSIVDEAHKHGLHAMAHVQTVDDARHAVELGIDRLVHLPHLGELTLDSLEWLSGLPISTTVHLQAPIRGPNGSQLNHGGREYTEDQLPLEQAHLAEVAQIVRALWASGAVIAFGTDPYRGQPVTQNPTAHEIETLAQMLEPPELIAALTLNAAKYLDLEDELGSIEQGKLADIVIVDGDPLVDVAALSKVVLVFRDGKIVVDNR